MKHNTKQWKGIQYNTAHYKAIENNRTQYKVIEHFTTQYIAIQGHTQKCNTIQYKTKGHGVVCPGTLRAKDMMNMDWQAALTAVDTNISTMLESEARLKRSQ